MRTISMRFLIGALACTLVALGACGDDDDNDTVIVDPTSTTAAASETTTSAAPDTTPTTVDDGPGTVACATIPVPDADLPGEVFDLFPYEGASMAVVGVEADDVLNVRCGPSADNEIVAELGPLSDFEAIATGRNRLVGESIWAEIEVADTTGWANSRFLLQTGSITDVTSQLYPTPADRPSAETLADLADVVADEFRSEEPIPRVVVVDGPSVGDLGEITIDVLGLGDDAVGGVRLHIFAEEGPDRFTVRTIEQTDLCSRGVSEGLCV